MSEDFPLPAPLDEGPVVGLNEGVHGAQRAFCEGVGAEGDDLAGPYLLMDPLFVIGEPFPNHLLLDMMGSPCHPYPFKPPLE